MTGLLGMWEGTEIVELAQIWDGTVTGDKINGRVADDKLFIVPVKDEKFIKLVNEGDVRVKQVSDGLTNRDMTEEYQIQAKLGCGIVMAGGMGIYDAIA